MPLLTLFYKYFLLQHSSSTLSSCILQTHLPGSGLCRRTQELWQESSSTVLQVSDLLLLQEEMAVNFIVSEVILPSSSLFLPHFYLFVCLLTQHFFLFLFLFFQSSTLQDLIEKIVIPTEQIHLQCLGPLGDPDPTDVINAETNKILFRTENFSLDLWKDTFRSWPSSTKGWKDWFLRVSNSNEVHQGERKLDQCIRLSIADMNRNESLLIAASYFWSDTLNAFMFGHGPASPTLADVLMLTSLDIASADDSHLYDHKPERKVETRNISGWSGYIQKYQKTGPVGQREHATFLNMWLDKFVFCGRSVGPTSFYLSTAERLADGGRFLLAHTCSVLPITSSTK